LYPVSDNLYGIADQTKLYYWQSVDFSVFLPVPTPLTWLGFHSYALSTLDTLGCCYDNGGGEDYSHIFFCPHPVCICRAMTGTGIIVRDSRISHRARFLDTLFQGIFKRRPTLFLLHKYYY